MTPFLHHFSFLDAYKYEKKTQLNGESVVNEQLVNPANQQSIVSTRRKKKTTIIEL